MNTDQWTADMAALNPFHQKRPLCGASIGGFNGEHLPPVSYGGVILVDDEHYGMSVHHLLDNPSDDESEAADDFPSPYPNDVVLSSAASNQNPWLMAMGTQPGLDVGADEHMGMWDLELSDDEEMKSNDDAESYHFSEPECSWHLGPCWHPGAQFQFQNQCSSSDGFPAPVSST